MDDEVCEICEKNMTRAVRCDAIALVFHDNSHEEELERLRFGEETRFARAGEPVGYTPGERCQDCNVRLGEYHHPGCDREECPRCRRQLLSCDCAVGRIKVNKSAARRAPGLSSEAVQRP